MILGLIIACEVGFWVVLLGGLAARYLARKPRLGAVLLALAPVVDAVLLVAVGIDLKNGATATWAHGLAALYIGFSVAFGQQIIHWADVRFAHRFAAGPAPIKVHGMAHARASWLGTLRLWLGAAIAAAILCGLTAWVGDPARTAALTSWLGTLGVILAVDLIVSITYTIWPKRAPTT